MTAAVYEFIEFLRDDFSIEIPELAIKEFSNKRDVKQRPNIAVNDLILSKVSETFNVSVFLIMSRSRKKEIAYAKHAHRYFLKNFTKLSLKAIGDMVGGYDHSSVLHSVDTVNDLMQTDKDYKAKIFACSEAIKMNLATN